MSTAYVVVAIATLVPNAAAALADFARARFVVRNATEVGVAEKWIPLLGGLKAAGALGLVVGLLWFPVIGAAAAFGLVLFFVGAVAVHIKSRCSTTSRRQSSSSRWQRHR
jgi:hypothetical protein